MTADTSLVAINDRGRVIGEDHQRARFSDREIDLMRTLYERGAGPSEIARAFDTTKRYVMKVVNYEVRAQTPAGYRRR